MSRRSDAVAAIGRSPWRVAAVVATVVLAIGAGVVVASSMTGLREESATGQSASPSPSAVATAPSSASPSAPPPTAAASTQATPVPTALPSAEPTPAPAVAERFAPDTVVATTVENLSLRVTPGTDGELWGHLSEGTLGFVMAEPVEIDGVPWYPVTGMGLPWASGCTTGPLPESPVACPAYHGWVAGTDADGSPWVTAAEPPNCPSEPVSLEQISETQTTMRLICWSGQELTFRAWWPTLPQDGLGGFCGGPPEEARFLVCQGLNYNGVSTSEREDFFNTRLRLSIDPASDVSMPEREQWIEVTGHFDDPAAQLCAKPWSEPAEVDLVWQTFMCRLQFVPTSIAVSD